MEVVKGKVELVLKDEPCSVVKVASDNFGTVVVTGNIRARPGDSVEVVGTWEENREHGRLFRAFKCRLISPQRTDGIKKLLGSGLIKGVGPEIAERIVDNFGERALDVLEHYPEELLKVKGIGSKKVELIVEAYRKLKGMEKGMAFLCSCGLGPGYARRVVEIYGDKTEERIKKNPYILVESVHGIGFKTADRVALRLGLDRDSTMRVGAGILYVLKKESEAGNTCVSRSELRNRVSRLLSVEPGSVDLALGKLLDGGKVVEEEGMLFLDELHQAEVSSAENVARLLSYARRGTELRFLKDFIEKEEARRGINLSREQKVAVEEALKGGVVVVTGGPGTGKTTVVRFIVEVYHALGKKVVLCAPTGRAAERLKEVVGEPAKTVHRLLEYDPMTSSFRKGRTNPISADVVIVDEASMLDVELFSSLLDAVPSGASLILVGDSDQLPSVGPGNVLRDVVDSGVIPVVRLNTLFRQSEESMIVVNAHRINKGLFPKMDNKPGSGFYFIERDDPERTLSTLRELYVERIPSAFGLDPVKDIQVLSPMRRGIAGVNNINRELQRLINPGAKKVPGSFDIGIGDKVMQIRNNYAKDVFNGDVGVVEDVSEKEGVFYVRFGERVVSYEFHELGELSLSYASSVHKSQGSEHRAVILVLLMQHYPLLQRNLLYTAVTRAKDLFVLLGSRRAVHIAVRNNRAVERSTLLRDRLRKALRKSLNQICYKHCHEKTGSHG